MHLYFENKHGKSFWITIKYIFGLVESIFGTHSDCEHMQIEFIPEIVYGDRMDRRVMVLFLLWAEWNLMSALWNLLFVQLIGVFVVVCAVCISFALPTILKYESKNNLEFDWITQCATISIATHSISIKNVWILPFNYCDLKMSENRVKEEVKNGTKSLLLNWRSRQLREKKYPGLYIHLGQTTWRGRAKPIWMTCKLQYHPIIRTFLLSFTLWSIYNLPSSHPW